jgi:uncharacterized protein YlxW (UPF0749 family)
MILNPKNRQEAMALLTLRSDTLRKLKADQRELQEEIDHLTNYIKKCNDKQQLDMFGTTQGVANG